RTLWAWTAGQALDMAVVGILSGLGLWCIGVPLALALGVVAGMANFIPYIGAFVGAVPAVLVGLSQGTREGLLVLALYAAIQFFEGNVMAPLIQRHAVQMPPGLTILSQTVFGTILGLPGLILASPLTAALLAVMDHATPPLDETDRLGPPDDQPGDQPGDPPRDQACDEA
ncbi:AI-2E family transporter, partial [Nguyenibacter vanlangensis]|uniref:AI-2E family transporter n=1 Tax=Nguyenibacter vanlangensis TaxID=1216886 RepID=UPI001FE36BC9